MSFSDKEKLNEKRWYKRHEFIAHAPWGFASVLSFLFGTLNHSTGLIQVGVATLICGSLSLALMKINRKKANDI